MSKSIRRVAIVGGTHGNEWTGIYLIRKFQRSPKLIERSSFETITLFANPKAIAANRRYIDSDLNRSFADEDLSNPYLTEYEAIRAKEIAVELGPKHKPQVDLIIDLHSTTANMGRTIFPTTLDLFNLKLSAYLNQAQPDIHIAVGMKCTQKESSMLPSLCPWGVTIEVGAVAQGVLNGYFLRQTEHLVHMILDYIEALNQGNSLSIPSALTIYQAISEIHYPRNADGTLEAFIHPERQSKDYDPINFNDPLFLSFTGESISYEGESTVFPIFINEASYYEKGIAMILTQKHHIELEVV
ncbi:aspartoacylase [Leptolyngbya sp. GGD]|uniref:aspartoacylase n=1 Tax=Leptolyngbya sp. GGD TaxID=2997907 RepID=UPI00227B4688|nr:aspartoacylase [Leptolyngbya sp. GGD]MCY6494570.1 aspartoacylase [Leptolyngbya sp. GGD]